MNIKLTSMAFILLAGATAGFLGAVPAWADSDSLTISPSETVTVRPGTFEHVRAGEFLQGGRPARAPRRAISVRRPLEIMRYQVTLADYGKCVSQGACSPADGRGPDDGPVTGVSYLDATAYAEWLSDVTGDRWRLPTDEEWALAAAERFVPDIEPTEEDPDNPALAWLSSYRREANLRRKPDPFTKSKGAFGENSNGVADIAGNVWEWTSSCYMRVALDEHGESLSEVENCGVHVVEGFHRTYMSNFIRDGKSGGCAVGLPPDNLGFRLVRDRPGFLRKMLDLLS